MKRKIGIIGSGSMGTILVKGFTKFLSPENIFVSNRSFEKAQRLNKLYKVFAVKHNEELLEQCEVIILAVKPQDFLQSLEPLSPFFHKEHVVFSLAAGVSTDLIKRVVTNTSGVIRVMPNLATSISKGLFAMYLQKPNLVLTRLSENLFQPLGRVIFFEEEHQMGPFTVACSSGMGFVYEIMEYWKEWLEEHGFSSQQAHQMVLEVFKGATLMAQEERLDFLELQKKVTSKKGVTEEGLRAIRENDLEQVLRVSFEKALLREKALTQLLEQESQSHKS